MRRFIIKYTYGRYWWKLPFQKHYNNTARGPFWFFNGFLAICVFFWVFGFGLGFSIPWAVFVLYFGFPLSGLGYYDNYPVRWFELDNEQKWWYGQGVMMGEAPRGYHLNASQMAEWKSLNAWFKQKYNLK